MISPKGAFFSSENAVSQGEEGKFYLWTEKEVKKGLKDKPGDLFCRFYGVTSEGNFEEGENILHIAKPVEEFAREEGMPPEKLEKILEQSREELFRIRGKRIHPSKDDKILTDWNGLMIAALSKGAQALSQPEYAVAARGAADFLLQSLRGPDGRLLHRYREGEAAFPGYVDDYAFLVWGLIELYETTFDERYLGEALDLTLDMLNIFWDEEEGGFYFTSNHAETILVRTKEIQDGAIPSGNSVALLNLLRLARMTANLELERKAEQLMGALGAQVIRSPTGFCQFLIALDFAFGPTKEVVIAGELDVENTQKMLGAIWTRFLPRKVLILHPEGEKGSAIEKIAPFVENQSKSDGKVTAYVCQNYVCTLPTFEVKEMISLLESND